MNIDIRSEIEAINNMYKTHAEQTAFRGLIFGDVGTGKTSLIKTCPRPIHVDSFDPDGTTTIRDEIKQGWIVADTRWELDDPDKPTQFVEFEKVFDKRRADGYFNFFGTYVLDSLTTFGDAAMNGLLSKLGRKNGIPQTGKTGDNDYVSQQKLIEPLIRQMLNLPCHVIILAHPDLRSDEDTGKKTVGPKVYGQLALKLPLMFSEIYCTQTEVSKEGLTYRLLTKQNGYFRCRSRLANKGQLNMYEEQDIKQILKKTGFNAEDRPIPWLEKEEATCDTKSQPL